MMKNAFYFVAFVCLSGTFILTNYAAGGEYSPFHEGFTQAYGLYLKQGSETKEMRGELVVGPKTNINGIEVYLTTNTLRNANGESVAVKYFSLENDQGVKSIARQGPHDRNPMVNEHEVWELKYPLAAETTWTSTEQVFSLKEKLFVPFTCVIETMDDVVTVPAGTFERCMRVRKYFNGTANLGAYGGNPNVTVERLSWYAPNIGEIKGNSVTKCSNAELGGGESHMEMISYRN